MVSELFGSEVCGSVDVDEQPVKRNIADRSLEEDVDDGCGVEVTQTAQHQQQFAEARRLSRVVSLRVSTECHLSLVLKAGYSCRVGQLSWRLVVAIC